MPIRARAEDGMRLRGAPQQYARVSFERTVDISYGQIKRSSWKQCKKLFEYGLVRARIHELITGRHSACAFLSDASSRDGPENLSH